MSATLTNEKPTFSHYSITDRVIFKGFTKNEQGTFFAAVSLPSGQSDGAQTFVNVSAVVSKDAAMQAIAKALCDIPINDGKGTSAKVTLTNMKATLNYDESKNIRCNEAGEPFINYRAFLNEIAFS